MLLLTLGRGEMYTHTHTPAKFLLANASPLPETHFGHAQTWHCRPSEKEEAKYLALFAVPGSTSAFRTSSKTLTFLRQTGPDARGWCTLRVWPLERSQGFHQSHTSVALKGRPTLSPEEIFWQLDSGYALLARLPQKWCAHHAAPICRSRK